jgi:hypothetical protein
MDAHKAVEALWNLRSSHLPVAELEGLVKQAEEEAAKSAAAASAAHGAWLEASALKQDELPKLVAQI